MQRQIRANQQNVCAIRVMSMCGKELRERGGRGSKGGRNTTHLSMKRPSGNRLDEVPQPLGIGCSR